MNSIQLTGIASHPTVLFFDVIIDDIVYHWTTQVETPDANKYLNDHIQDFVDDINLQISEGKNPSPRLTKQDLIKLVKIKYFTDRDQYFIDGMTFRNSTGGDIVYSITAKAKQDYTALMIMKDVISYPYILHGDNGYSIFETVKDLVLFLGIVFQFCQVKELQCQQDIAVLPDKTRDELLAILGINENPSPVDRPF